jgi:hypothetical protein
MPHRARVASGTSLRSPGATPAGRHRLLGVPQAHHLDRFDNRVGIFHVRTAFHAGTLLHERTYFWIREGYSLLEITCQHSSWTDPTGTGLYWILKATSGYYLQTETVGPSPAVPTERRCGSRAGPWALQMNARSALLNHRRVLLRPYPPFRWSSRSSTGPGATSPGDGESAAKDRTASAQPLEESRLYAAQDFKDATIGKL